MTGRISEGQYQFFNYTLYTRNGYELLIVAPNRFKLRQGGERSDILGRTFELREDMSPHEMQGRLNIETDEMEQARREATGFYDGW